jgi:galacturan 1,4-alpha-galacturonidase
MLSVFFTAALGATTALASLDLAERYSDPQTCVVPSHGNANVSDTPAILAAFKKCGKGGRIIFSENTTYALNELTVGAGCRFN